ncbi:MAG: adenosine deaminase [Solirubrobacterales bacterium]|jgi:adenosine deaminase|nr:adenosine deaminase [Solirubrobacterales bacterium]
MIAQAELHVHLEGTAPPELMSRIAARNSLALPLGLVSDDGSYHWRDFLHFLQAYDAAASLLRTPEDFRDVVFEYLVGCAREGAIYVELIASPDHAAAAGVSDADHVAALAQGIDDARAASGIEARILMSCVRNFGPEAAVAVAERTVAHPHPYVTGFNMGGDEAGFPPGHFAPAFAIVAEAGLGLSCHAGEWAGPESVRGALALGVTRLSHGVRAVEDPALVAELAERGIVLECCPTSNVVLGVYPDYASHPFLALHEAGVRLTLGSDDPPYFGASLAGEYAVAATAFGLDDDELRGLTRTAIGAAFVPEDLRSSLLAAVEEDDDRIKL